MAVYLIEDREGNKTLVETRTKAGAINYVAQGEYTAKTLNTSELVTYIKAGIEVQTIASSEPSEEKAENLPPLDKMLEGKKDTLESVELEDVKEVA